MPIPDDMPLDRAALPACAVITGVGAVVNIARATPGSSVVLQVDIREVLRRRHQLVGNAVGLGGLGTNR